LGAPGSIPGVASIWRYVISGFHHFLAKYDKWAENDFENTKIEKTIKRDAINRGSKKNVNCKEGSVKDKDIADKGIDRSSTKRN